jgi:8-amino-7-oxononanoate synthase
MLSRLEAELAQLKVRGLGRTLSLSRGLDFSSNDYLGFARHPLILEAARAALSRWGRLGASGSRLLAGHHEEHEALEAEAAAFFGVEAALYFNSGFDANMALFSVLPAPRSCVLYDEKIHASVKEGIRASLASKAPFRHNDLLDAEKRLRLARSRGARELFIAIESLYSMEGDLAPLSGFLELARRFEATLVVDEAHATGVLGRTGRGALEGSKASGVIALHTCGKALGAAGALVAGPRLVVDYLINRARPFLYSTAQPPVVAAAVRRALSLVDEEPWRRERLREISVLASSRFKGALSRWTAREGATPVVPVLIGSEEEAVAASQELSRRGFDVRAVRPPTVPRGTARLRVSINVQRREREIEELSANLVEIEKILETSVAPAAA